MAENGLMESELKVEELKADFAKLHPPPKMNEALEQVIEICRKHPEGLPNLKTFLNELIPWIQVKDSQAESKRMRNYDGHRDSDCSERALTPDTQNTQSSLCCCCGPQESWRSTSWMSRRGWMLLSTVWRNISWMSRRGWMLLSTVWRNISWMSRRGWMLLSTVWRSTSWMIIGGWMLLSTVLSLIPNGIGFKKPSVNVHRIVTSKTHGADDQIIEKLGKKLQLIDSGLADCAGVLLFCVANTRAGSDVDEAMGKIPVAAREKPVILVLMHHDYNKDCAIDTTDLSTEYDKVELHVNVIFHQSKKGLLNCKRNDDAIKEIVKQCKQWNPET